jgi:hypothetical protein
MAEQAGGKLGKLLSANVGHFPDNGAKFSDGYIYRRRRLQHLVARENHVYFRKASLPAAISFTGLINVHPPLQHAERGIYISSAKSHTLLGGRELYSFRNKLRDIQRDAVLPGQVCQKLDQLILIGVDKIGGQLILLAGGSFFRIIFAMDAGMPFESSIATGLFDCRSFSVITGSNCSIMLP